MNPRNLSLAAHRFWKLATLVVCLEPALATPASAQRQGLTSTFGDSAKITNGFSFSRDGRTLYTSERQSLGLQGGRHVWAMHDFGGRRGLTNTLFEYDIIDGHSRNRRRVAFANDSLDYYPLLSHDETRLYFNSRRPIPPRDSIDGNYVHIWMSERQGQRWGAARYVAELNIPGVISQYAQQLADSSVIFSSNRAGSVAGPTGAPSLDLWLARWRDGRWEAPTNLTEFNSPATEEQPFIDRTGRLLFFKRVTDTGDAVYLSVHDGTSWRPPRLVPLTDAGGFDEHSPRVSADGQTFYFSHGLTMMHISLNALLVDEERRILGTAARGRIPDRSYRSQTPQPRQP